jgi:glucose-1-phosphate cytidylyltransferase
MTTDISDLPLVILCGGRGSRLRPATDALPKALIPVNGQPIVDYIVNFFSTTGIREFHLCIGYRGDQIREHFADRHDSTDCFFSDSGGTAGILERIYALRDNIADRFVVAYCDTFIDLDLVGLNAYHAETGASITLVTAPIQSPFGLVGGGDTPRVKSFEEKPIQDYFIGCFVMERQVLDDLPEHLVKRPDGAGIVELFQKLVAEQELSAYRHDGLNITFNTNSERIHAERELDSFFTLRE